MHTRCSSAVRRQGFTLIELLIVIVIIAILALIVVPRTIYITKDSMEVTLRTQLHTMRTAIERFNADTGYYPTSLSQLVVTDKSQLPPYMAQGYTGPYFTATGGIDGSGIPKNPFGTEPTGNLEADIQAHWSYENTRVKSAVDGSTRDGIAYSAL